MKSMNNFIGDELANKVKYLSTALKTANHIIAELEAENQRLNQILLDLTDKESQLSDQCAGSCA